MPQRFIHVLTDHLSQCESRRCDFNTPWYKWIVERLQQFFLLVSCLFLTLCAIACAVLLHMPVSVPAVAISPPTSFHKRRQNPGSCYCCCWVCFAVFSLSVLYCRALIFLSYLLKLLVSVNLLSWDNGLKCSCHCLAALDLQPKPIHLFVSWPSVLRGDISTEALVVSGFLCKLSGLEYFSCVAIFCLLSKLFNLSHHCIFRCVKFLLLS